MKKKVVLNVIILSRLIGAYGFVYADNFNFITFKEPKMKLKEILKIRLIEILGILEMLLQKILVKP